MSYIAPLIKERRAHSVESYQQIKKQNTSDGKPSLDIYYETCYLLDNCLSCYFISYSAFIIISITSFLGVYFLSLPYGISYLVSNSHNNDEMSLIP